MTSSNLADQQPEDLVYSTAFRKKASVNNTAGPARFPALSASLNSCSHIPAAPDGIRLKRKTPRLLHEARRRGIKRKDI